MLGVTLSEGLDRGRSALALFAAERLSHHVAVHAGLIVVNGIAIVLPGHRFLGRERSARQRAKAGFRY